MSISTELLLLYFAFSSVIVPGIVYTTYTYNPSDLLGWVSKFVFVIISFMGVVVFFPSIFFMYFYCWLHRKHNLRKAARQESNELSSPENPASDAPAASQSSSALSHKVSNALYKTTYEYVKSNYPQYDIFYIIFFWSSFYYCILDFLPSDSFAEEVKRDFHSLLQEITIKLNYHSKSYRHFCQYQDKLISSMMAEISCPYSMTGVLKIFYMFHCIILGSSNPDLTPDQVPVPDADDSEVSAFIDSLESLEHIICEILDEE